jgi:pyridoxine 5-phosphate synthase
MAVELGVNIDHVATLRQARKTYEPDPAWAAAEAELGGADGITVHLREDRRHIVDRDIEVLKQVVHTKLNFEMSLVEEIVRIAIRTAPQQATLVPERREEVTTEGGLNLAAHGPRAGEVAKRLRDAGVFVSAFIDPDVKQVQLAAELGFDAVELHTGEYANARPADQWRQLERITAAAEVARDRGLRLHAGHGLNYLNVAPLCGIATMRELNIGHAIVSRAVFVGLREAVRQMKSAMNAATTGRSEV